MHVSIDLESPRSTWTNLDRICGRIRLQTTTVTPIISISVKLEGESRTKLKAPPRALSGQVDGAYDDWGGEKLVTREERHKLLYRTANVFPPQNNMTPTVRYHTLPAGQFEFPFEFKFPFNNACEDFGASTVTNLTQMARVGVKGASAPVRHIKRALPPTLTTFPGLAEVRYYVKVTVNRKEFYKENPRSLQYLNFLPIEPPRDLPTGSESFARRQHQFQPLDPARSKLKKSLFSGKTFAGADMDTGTAPLVRVDVRLPSPAILTCNQPLPMRIIVQRLNESTERLFLQSLHVMLHATTNFRANEITRDESTNWVILSTSNMRLPLRGDIAKKATEQGEEMVIDSSLWRNQPLPNSIAPTFETCNIRRTYELEVHVGLSYRNGEGTNTITIPLRHKVKVYSGIQPPPQLVGLMAAQRNNPHFQRKPVAQPTGRPEKSPSVTAPLHLRTNFNAQGPSSSQAGPSTPIVASPSTPYTAGQFQASSTVESPQYAPLPPGEEEPPPSYEDAIGQDLPPLTGPRAVYEQPPRVGMGGGFGDTKGDRDD